PSLSKILIVATMVYNNSSSGVNSSSWCPTYDCAPRPPPKNTLKPRCCFPLISANCGISPMSTILAMPCFSQHVKLILNFLGSDWLIGFLNKNLVAATAYGVGSKTSSGQTPASGLHIILLTEFPHASLVVIPTSAKPLRTSETSSKATQ